MIKFERSELDRFNDRVKNILENGNCVGIFKQYLRDVRPDLYNAFRLWRKAHKASVHGRSATDAMFDLMEEINGFNVVDDGNLEDIMNECCNLLDRTVKDDFIEHLKKHHK